MRAITDNDEMMREYGMFPKVNKRYRFLQQLERIITDFRNGRPSITLEIEDNSYDLFMLLFADSILVQMISDFREEKQEHSTLFTLTKGDHVK